MTSYLRPRRGKQATASSQLTASNPLKRGEIFFEVPNTGVGTGTGKIKMGDGSTAYSSLPYFLSIDDSNITFTDNSTSSRWDNCNNYISNIKSGITLPTFFSNVKNLLYQLVNKVNIINNDLSGYLPLAGGTITGTLKSQDYILVQQEGLGIVEIRNDKIVLGHSHNAYNTTITQSEVAVNGAGTSVKLKANNINRIAGTSEYNYSFPDKSGTIVMQSDIENITKKYDFYSRIGRQGGTGVPSGAKDEICLVISDISQKYIGHNFESNPSFGATFNIPIKSITSNKQYFTSTDIRLKNGKITFIQFVVLVYTNNIRFENMYLYDPDTGERTLYNDEGEYCMSIYYR